MACRYMMLCLLPCLLAGDWRQFRGPDAQAISPTALPRALDADNNIAWKVPLPGRGLSSPIVVGDRVFVTASGGDRQNQLYVMAFAAKDGKPLWQRSFWATGPTASHPKTCMAAPTPASDGQVIVALFATNDLVCLDLDGNPRWIRSLYAENVGATDGRGLASSPLIVDDTVLVQIENLNTSFAAGIDLATGQNRWHIDRPHGYNWTSPIPLPSADGEKPRVLLQGLEQLDAIDPHSGKIIWSLKRPSDAIASSIVAGNTLYVPGGEGLTAFELRGNQAPEPRWRNRRLNPSTASPIVLGERIYSLRGSLLVAANRLDGELIGRLRVKGPFSSSPVAANDLLYCFSEDGTATVVQPSASGEDTILSTGELGETILCTPAIANQAMYVRSDQHLWKIQQTP